MVPQGAPPPDDHEIADLADRQDGVVGRDQLRGLGLAGPAIAKRVQRGRLFVVHRGVYAVGRRQITIRGQWQAALLAVGPAAPSHRQQPRSGTFVRSQTGTSTSRYQPDPDEESDRA